MTTIVLGLLLLGLTCIASLLHRAVRLPLPVLQILLGVLIALPPLHLRIAFDPHAFLLLFIPPLLFADGWRLPRRELRALRWPLLGTAVGLVLVTVLIGGFGLHWLIRTLPLPVAFAIAAVVAPTDAVAFAAVTGNVAVPIRLQHLMESEALLNDASGLVALRFAIAAALTGAFSPLNAAGSFLLIAFGGLAIGWLVATAQGWAVKHLNLRDGEAPVEALLSALLPFAAYLLAEQVHVSGILAAVAAGFATNRADTARDGHFSARMQSGSMWRLINYAFNGVIFVLLGTQLPAIVGPEPGGLDLAAAEAPLAVLSQLAALFALLIVVRLAWVLASITVERLTRRIDDWPSWRIVLAASFGGVRGAITLAGVMTLPLTLPNGTPFPSRDLAITLATGIILLSLLVALVVLPPLLRPLKPEQGTLPGEIRTARIAAMESAVDALQSLPDDSEERTSVLNAYQRRLQTIRDRPTGDPLAEEEETWRALHAVALNAERAAVQRLLAENAINDEAARTVVHEIDLLEAASVERPLRLRPEPST